MMENALYCLRSNRSNNWNEGKINPKGNSVKEQNKDP